MISSTIFTRKNILWKLARGYCLCYCKTFLLVAEPTECKKSFTEECRRDFFVYLTQNFLAPEILLVNGKHLMYILYIYCTNRLKVISFQ